MEARTEDPGLTRRPTLASSWDAPCGALSQNLFLSRGGLGAGEFDWEELLAPPAPGQDLMILKRNLSSQEESPCFLYLTCDPNGGEEIVSLGILSSARNMEVYLGEEYLGTSRGRNVCTVLDNSEPEKIILYKKYLKLESSTHACKVKLLSFGEKHYVFVSKIVVHMRPASASSAASCPALGSRIDLGRVQTIVESIGSKLSPGAQQLMNMVRVQQQNYMPLGEQLQSVLGNTGDKLMIGQQSVPTLAALNKSPFTPFPFRTGLTPGKVPDDVRADPDKNVWPPGGGDPSDPHECGSVLQSQALLDSRLQDAISSFLPKKASGNSDIPSSDLLPFLQNLCSQVNHLRVGNKTEWQEKITKPREGVVGVGVEEQPVCSYLEKILSKNMELMEKNLTDYIDQRICKLQEHLDNKIALLMNLLQSSNSVTPGMPLRQYDSGERLSNGER
ncbi:PREDICTED: uncharacterized protein C10orf88 homolog [Chrysochloris asiatica]|uniref:Uncharacterized protein C10orf88 homolog n=1 Tax=Chrysochloris asiatica TaxID=185453 RepID=A0A9B0WTM0_CHRAS|nr:PREDICTED: uncharacterized protein C10orf88 homolog [Chrysochloris asiatica]